MSMLDSELRKWLEERLPDFFQKKDLDTLTSGVITANNVRQILFRHPSMRPFPGHRIGRKVMVKREELLEWLEKYNDRISKTDGRAVRTDAGDEGEAGSTGEAPEGKGGGA